MAWVGGMPEIGLARSKGLYLGLCWLPGLSFTWGYSEKLVPGWRGFRGQGSEVWRSWDSRVREGTEALLLDL